MYDALPGISLPAIRLVSAPAPGRIRLAVCGLQRNAARARALEAALRDLPGVRIVEASPHTGNLLVVFEPDHCSTDRVLALAAEAIGAAPTELASSETAAEAP